MEDGCLRLCCDSDAGVAHFHADQNLFAGTARLPNVDQYFAARGELDRIPHQVRQDLSQTARIATQFRWSFGINAVAELQVLLMSLLGKQLGDFFHHAGKIEFDMLQVKLAGFHFGKVQNVIDDRQ